MVTSAVVYSAMGLVWMSVHTVSMAHAGTTHQTLLPLRRTPHDLVVHGQNLVHLRLHADHVGGVVVVNLHTRVQLDICVHVRTEIKTHPHLHE